MYPRRLLIAAGLLAFVGCLLVLAPVRYLLRLAPPGIAGQVSEASGTLWQGSAKVAAARNALSVSWDSHPASLLLLRAVCDWTVAGDGFAASGSLTATPRGYRLQVERGELGAAAISRLFAGARATLDQPLSMQAIDVSVARGGRVEEAAGRLAWGPGSLQVAGRPDALSLPALRGLLRPVDGKLRLQVDGESDPGASLATLDLDLAANDLHLVVTQRGARLAGVVPTSPASPDGPFFELRQPLR